jgi:hypothetical protein
LTESLPLLEIQEVQHRSFDSFSNARIFSGSALSKLEELSMLYSV